MDKKYIELFKAVSQSSAASAEQVMEYDLKNDDQHGAEIATTMRNDFQDLAARVESADYILTRLDAIKLLAGAFIITGQLQDKITTLKRALTGYQTELIPKLQDIVNNAKDDETAQTMAEEKFIVKDEEVNI